VDRRIEAATPVRTSLERVRRVVEQDPRTVLGGRPRGGRGDGHRVSLTVPLRGGSSAVQEVTVRLGAPDGTDDSVVWPISWTPSAPSRVLPDLHGTLTARRERGHTLLTLAGTYRPPLGRLGAFGDGLVGHRVARASVQAFLEGMAERIAAETARRMATAGVLPCPGTPDLRPPAG
jgi:hypothetical protein